ncbi:hypothetical protein [Sporosarcina sp. P3]|uniref:hypothetical protein n=1 Tax=Sporosarcina sp. P3 TaxID=2048245 RepID=UPI0013040B1D|nr:hypothetical protein [Sporosarcina sp. P3]
MRTANTVNPMPPSWVSMSNTTSPKMVNVTVISKTLSLVTVVAEAAVKGAFIQLIGL